MLPNIAEKAAESGSPWARGEGFVGFLELGVEVAFFLVGVLGFLAGDLVGGEDFLLDVVVGDVHVSGWCMSPACRGARGGFLRVIRETRCKRDRGKGNLT